MILAFWVTDICLELLFSVAADIHQKTTMQIQIPYVVMNSDTIHCILVIDNLLQLFYFGVSWMRFQDVDI